MPIERSARSARSEPERARTSLLLHRIIEGATHALTAVIVGVLVLVSWVIIVASGFDESIQIVFGTVCAGITVTMVFVLQHTQRREQLALQLKLNELIRALPEADDHLISVEGSSDDEILEIGSHHVDQHTALREAEDSARPI